MSITIVKKSGVNMPSENIMKKCSLYYNKNIGFAYVRDGKIIVNKKFSSQDEFFSSLNTSKIRTEDCLIIYMSNKIEDNDPVPLTNQKELMKSELVECSCSVWSHDGELKYNEKIKNFSDFVSMIYEINLEQFKQIINMCFDSSKIAVLHPNNELELFGTWHNEYGILFSNYFFKKSDKKIRKMMKSSK